MRKIAQITIVYLFLSIYKLRDLDDLLLQIQDCEIGKLSLLLLLLLKLVLFFGILLTMVLFFRGGLEQTEELFDYLEVVDLFLGMLN